MRQAGAARDRHHGHVRRLVLVLRALHRPLARDRADRPRGGRPLAAGRPVHRRHRARDFAPALLALLHPRDEERPATSASTSRSPACSPRAWSCTRPTAPDGEWVEPAQVTIESAGDDAPRQDDRDRRAGRDRRRSRRCRSRRRTSSTPTTSWAATAPTSRAGSCCRIRRPSATSNGPSAACRAPGDSRSGSGGWSARRPRWRRRRRRQRPAQFGEGGAGAAQGRARRARQGVGRDREAALQRRGRAPLRVRQCVQRVDRRAGERADAGLCAGRCARRPRSW